MSDDSFPVGFKIARDASRNSTCRRRQVGAALFDARGNLFSVGWNNERPAVGLAPTPRNCSNGDCPRGNLSYKELPADAPYTNCIAQHAEMMAMQKVELLLATEEKPDLHMFVTHQPCHECQPVLSNAGIIVHLWVEGKDG